MADGPSIGTAYLRVAGDFSQVNAQAVGLFKSSKWSSLGKAAGVALAGGLVAGGALKALYDIGQQFDDVSDKIRIQTGATGKELGKLEQSFRNVVRKVPADFDTASSAVAGLAQRLDLTGRPLTRLSRQMTELSRITGTDIQSNVTSITRLFGDWGVSTSKQAGTLDKLFRASQETGVEIDSLASLMVQFGSPLRQLGLDFDTAAAMFSRFEKEGVNIQTLMPGLRMALKNFSMPTAELSATLKKVGVDIKDGPSVALADLMTAIEKAPTDLKANALAFQVFGARAGPDMAAAVREGRFELDELMATIAGGDDTIRKAGRQTMDFSEHWLKFKNNVLLELEPVATRVFDTLGDAMKEITGIMSDPDLSNTEKFDAFLGLVSEAVDNALPKLVDAGAKIAGAIGKGILNAWTDANPLAKVLIGAGLIRLLGGKGALLRSGAVIGTFIGSGVAAGTASGVAGSVAGGGIAGGVAGGIRGALGKVPALLKRAGGIGVGIAVVDGVMSDIDSAVKERSGEFTEALEGLADISTGESLKNLGQDFVSAWGFGDPGKEFDVAGKAQDLLDRLNEIQAAGEKIDLGEALDLKLSASDLEMTDEARGALNQYVDSITDASKGTRKLAASFGDVDSSTIKDELRGLVATYGSLQNAGASMSKGQRKAWLEIAQAAANDGLISQNAVVKLRQAFEEAEGKIDSVWKRIGKRTGETAQEVKDRTGSMARDFIKSIAGMEGATAQGMAAIANDTNKALRAFGVAEVNWASSSENRGAGGQGHLGRQRGGKIVGGIGSGDKVPALLEPGEVVWNREAVKAMGGAGVADAINRAIPRFQGGGIAGSFNVDGAKPGFVPFMNYLNSLFGPVYVMSGLRPGSITTSGNVSNHSSGRAVDISTTENALNMATSAATLNATGPAAARMDALHAHMARHIPTSEVSGDFLWRTFTGGNHFNHIHRGITNGLAEDVGAMLQFLGTLPRGGGFGGLDKVLLKGPDGALKALGQAALDKVRKAAQKYISSKATTPTFGTGKIQDVPHAGGWQGIDSPEEFIPFWNQINPDQKQWGQTFARIVPRESTWIPTAENSIGLGHRGWYQFDPPTWGAFGQGSWDNAFNPALATAAAGNVMRQEGAGGLSRWAETVQKGGIIQGLQGGGIAGEIRQTQNRLREIKVRLQEDKLTDKERTRIGEIKDTLDRKGLSHERRQALQQELRGLQAQAGQLTPERRRDLVKKQKSLQDKLEKLRADLAERRADRTHNIEQKGLHPELKKKLKGAEDKIAEFDERITIAEDDFSLPGTEGDEEYGPTELSALLALYGDGSARGLLDWHERHRDIGQEQVDAAGTRLAEIDRLIADKDTPKWQRAALRENRGAIKEMRRQAHSVVVDEQGVTGGGGFIHDTLMEIKGLGGSGVTGTEDVTGALLQQLLDEERRTSAILRAQLPIFGAFNRAPFGGAFADGGVVPGPAGAPRTIVAHGGETVTPAGGMPVIHNHFYVEGNEIRGITRQEIESQVAQARSSGPTLGQKARI